LLLSPFAPLLPLVIAPPFPRENREERDKSPKANRDFVVILQKVHKIRITLTSRKVASLEKVCTELIER
jgi:hypothetical protein